MLISELIKLLQSYLAEHGDIPAVVALDEDLEMAEAASACLVALVDNRMIWSHEVDNFDDLQKAVRLC